MASNAFIIAHDNIFNRAILKNNAQYFNNNKDVAKYINTLKKTEHLHLVENNYNCIVKSFTWDIINNNYLDFFNECLAIK